MPYVVYEAVYAPEPNLEYPQFTPADVRLRFGTPARSEFDLVDHLKPQERVSCRAKAASESCLPEAVVADVKPFDPEHSAAAALPRVTGCAAIDAASEQDRLSQSQTFAAVIPARFSFGAGSPALSPDATPAASQIAQLLAQDPSIECLGVVGQISPGESPSLAEARARAVKQLLISLGVDSRRLLTIGVTANVFGPGAKAAASEPDSRRVSVTVLLKMAPQNPAP